MSEIDVLNELADFISDLRKKALSYGVIFKQNYPDIIAFENINNALVLIFELLDHYYDYFSKKNIKYFNQQSIDKIGTIFCWAFIEIFSIIEHYSKELIKRKKHYLFNKINQSFINDERVMFSQIIQRSYNIQIKHKIQLLNENDKILWDNLREIRNGIVHNMSIMDKNGIIKINEFKFEYNKGEPLNIDLAYPLNFIKIIIDLYYKWVIKIINLN